MAGSVVTAIRAFVLAIHVQYNRYGAEAEEVLGYLKQEYMKHTHLILTLYTSRGSKYPLFNGELI